MGHENYFLDKHEDGTWTGDHHFDARSWQEISWPPRYSTDWNAMRQVIDVLKERCKFVDLEIYPDETLCILVLDEDAVPEMIWRTAPTTPEAVCKTLLALEEE